MERKTRTLSIQSLEQRHLLAGLVADLNSDGCVDYVDFAEHFLPNFGTTFTDSRDHTADGDFNGDNVVDFIDFSGFFLPQFGTCTPITNEADFLDGMIATDIPIPGAEDYYERVDVAPNVTYGQRISGTYTFTPKLLADHRDDKTTPIEYRLLIDGQPQPSTTIDTTQFADGTYVAAMQVTNIPNVVHFSRVVAINNSGVPLTDLSDQAVTVKPFNPQQSNSSLAWGRVDVLPNESYPLGHNPAAHPFDGTDAERERMTYEPIWWVEGLSHGPTTLWSTIPIPAKNRAGDVFVAHFQPQASGWSQYSEEKTNAAPQYDGPRNVGWVSPYSTLVADDKVLASGYTGWIGVDITGRVMEIDITGEVRTIFGPRSVAGVIGTDPDLIDVTLADRIALGEKEFVGDASDTLDLPQDIYQIDDRFAIIADTQNDRVAVLDRETQSIVASYDLPGVTSVWASDEPSKQFYAASPTGLHALVTGDSELTQIVVIPRAHTVRGNGERVFVIDLSKGIHEFNETTGEVITRVEPQINPNGTPYDANFVFGAFDYNGTIGRTGLFYTGNIFNKTSIDWYDTNTWEHGSLSRADLQNYQPNGANVASSDPLGHYMWGFAVHGELNKFVTAGISSSSWFMWTAHLRDDLIQLEPTVSFATVEEYRYGVKDDHLPLSLIYGASGYGGIGYSADKYKAFASWEEARVTVMSDIGQFLPGDMDAAAAEELGEYLFLQRSRKHFY